jgi:ribosomal-protein-alanine N-acetyltransferase
VTEWPQALVVRDWSTADSDAVGRWRYDGRWSVYDQRADDAAVDAFGRRAVVSADDGRLIGFYCVGADARVPGLVADAAVVDLGLGMAPELVGQGHGVQFAQTVLDDVGRRLLPTPLRAVIQTWNTRSLALARRLGFTAAGNHRCRQDDGEVTYAVLIRDAES